MTAADQNPARGFSARPEGRSGLELVTLMGKLGCAGTLYLETKGGALLAVFSEGRVLADFPLTAGASLEQGCSHLRFYPMTPELIGESLPQLPSLAASSPVAALRALPDLAVETRLESSLLDFRALLARFQERGVSGALTVHADDDEGVALIHKGRLLAAAYGRENQVTRGAPALTQMYKRALEKNPLAFYPLGGALAAALAGLAQERGLSGAASADVKAFSGVEVGKQGYLFYGDGRPYLRVAAPTIGPPRLFQAQSGGEALALPDKPTGWEKRVYRLTLRGHDALDPMTELHLSFAGRFGPASVRLLKDIHAAVPTGKLAERLGLDEDTLKELVEALEQGGLIRALPER